MATQTDEIFTFSAPRSAEILPKRVYRARITDATQETFTPDPARLRPNESADPYPQLVLNLLLKVPTQKQPVTFIARLKDKPGRGPRSSLTKFETALANAGIPMRKSALVGLYLDVMIEDLFPSNEKGNWASDFWVSEDQGAGGAATPAPRPVAIEDEEEASSPF